MNAKTSHSLNRTKNSLLIGACLLLVATADAAAHEVIYRSYAVQRPHIRAQAPTFPHWLHRNRNFQRWYLGSRYRSMRDPSWHRLYEIYYLEERLRLQNRRFHGKVVHDRGYRTHRARPHKRRH